MPRGPMLDTSRTSTEFVFCDGPVVHPLVVIDRKSDRRTAELPHLIEEAG